MGRELRIFTGIENCVYFSQGHVEIPYANVGPSAAGENITTDITLKYGYRVSDRLAIKGDVVDDDIELPAPEFLLKVGLIGPIASDMIDAVPKLGRWLPRLNTVTRCLSCSASSTMSRPKYVVPPITRMSMIASFSICSMFLSKRQTLLDVLVYWVILYTRLEGGVKWGMASVGQRPFAFPTPSADPAGLCGMLRKLARGAS